MLSRQALLVDAAALSAGPVSTLCVYIGRPTSAELCLLDCRLINSRRLYQFCAVRNSVVDLAESVFRDLAWEAC